MGWMARLEFESFRNRRRFSRVDWMAERTNELLAIIRIKSLDPLFIGSWVGGHASRFHIKAFIRRWSARALLR